MACRITCINKAGGDHENPYIAISYLGWKEDGTNKTGKTSREDMYDWVSKGGEAYVVDTKGNMAYLEHKTSPKGTKYIKTKADDVKSDNLLSLSECPLFV